MAGDKSREHEPVPPAGWELWQAPHQRYGANSIIDSFFISTGPDLLLDGYRAEEDRRKDEIDGQLKRLAADTDEGAFLDEDGVATKLLPTFWTEAKRVILVYGYWDPRPEERLRDPRPLPHLIIKRKDDGRGDRKVEAIEFLRSTKLARKQQQPALETFLGKKMSRAKFRDLCRQAGLLNPGRKPKE